MRGPKKAEPNAPEAGATGLLRGRVQVAMEIFPQQNAAVALPIIPNHSAAIPDPSCSGEVVVFGRPKAPA
jgi:hypothetical protein